MCAGRLPWVAEACLVCGSGLSLATACLLQRLSLSCLVLPLPIAAAFLCCYHATILSAPAFLYRGLPFVYVHTTWVLFKRSDEECGGV